MKVAELLKSRQPFWRELETLCGELSTGRRRRMSAATVARFGTLYRGACADLALADSYQFPPATVHYLHQLVARAHNQLYRSRSFRVRAWLHVLFVTVPRRIFADRYLWLAMVIFWGIFGLSAALAYNTPEYAERVAGRDELSSLESDFAYPAAGRDSDTSLGMSGKYILRNPTIGLRCFAFGLFFGIGGLFFTIYNASLLGVEFGYMATVPQGENLFHFATAHGPFELTAIVFSAAAGMRMGFSLVNTGGRTRFDSLRRAALESVPIILAAVLMFTVAAGIEAFLSPSSAPYEIKAAVGIVSSVMLALYILVLGYPRRR